MHESDSADATVCWSKRSYDELPKKQNNVWQSKHESDAEVLEHYFQHVVPEEEMKLKNAVATIKYGEAGWVDKASFEDLTESNKSTPHILNGVYIAPGNCFAPFEELFFVHVSDAKHTGMKWSWLDYDQKGSLLLKRAMELFRGTSLKIDNKERKIPSCGHFYCQADKHCPFFSPFTFDNKSDQYLIKELIQERDTTGLY